MSSGDTGGIFGYIYQQPFVDVFKQAGVFDDKNTQAVGESTIVLDPQIGKRVIRIEGAISANNYVRLPHPTKKAVPAIPGSLLTTHSHGAALKVALSNVGTLGLGLTGPYLYIQLRAKQDEYFAFHVDVVTQEGPTMRLSYSNLYKSFKVSGQTLCFPCRIVTAKWTIFAMHLPSVLRTYANSSYKCIKSFQFCSNLFLRGVYTSELHYIVKSLPREMQLPVPKNTLWMDIYDWVWLRPVPTSSEDEPGVASNDQFLESASVTSMQSAPSQQPIVVSKAAPHIPAVVPKHDTAHPYIAEQGVASPPLYPTPQAHLARVGSITPRVKGHNITFDSAGTHMYYSSGPVVIVESLLDQSQEFLHGHNATVCTLALAKCGMLASGQEGLLPLIRLWDVHSLPLEEPRLDLHQDPSMFKERLAQLYSRRKQLQRAYANLSKEQQHSCQQDDFASIVRQAATVLGATSLQQSSTSAAAAAAVKAIPVNGAAVCVSSFVADVKSLHSVVFANCTTRNDMLLAITGADEHNRPVICVYDIAPVLLRGAVTSPVQPLLIARQVSEFPINRLRFHPKPSAQCLLVSVGQSNIRFYRLKNQHLPASSVALNEHARQHFLDFDFEATYGDGDTTRKRLFVSSSSGAVFQVSIDDRRLECIYQLHNGPIYALRVNEGFCITGSADGYLRVWPLDFSDYYLQALHPAAVVCTDVSDDGQKVAAVTEAGAIGILDQATSAYKTVLRGHTGTIQCMALSSILNQVATAAADGTVRVWDIHSMNQQYEFKCGVNETCSSLAFHDRDGSYRLLCCFTSGVMRVLDITTATTLVKVKQHTGPISTVLVSSCGQWVYTQGYDGKIAVYDISRNYQPIRTIDTAALTSLADAPVANILGTTQGIQPPLSYPTAVIAGIKTSRYPATSPAMAAAVAQPSQNTLPPALQTTQVNMRDTPTVDQQQNLAPSMSISEDGSLLAVTGESAHVVLLLDAMRLTEIFRIRTGSRAIVKIQFHTPVPSQCCSHKPSLKGGLAEVLLVYFTDCTFAKYSIPDCEQLYVSKNPDTTVTRGNNLATSYYGQGQVNTFDSHKMSHLNVLDPQHLQDLLHKHTSKGKKTLQASIANAASVASPHTTISRDHEFLQELFSSASTYRLCTTGNAMGDWVITTASTGNSGILQVWREGEENNQTFLGPQPYTCSAVIVPNTCFDVLSAECSCDCDSCMKIHEGEDAALLSASNEVHHLPRGTTMVLAAGGNAIYKYYIGKGASNLKKHKENIIQAKYDALLQLVTSDAHTNEDDVAYYGTATSASNSTGTTAAQRLRAKVDAAVIKTAHTQATAQYIANVPAYKQGGKFLTSPIHTEKEIVPLSKEEIQQKLREKTSIPRSTGTSGNTLSGACVLGVENKNRQVEVNDTVLLHGDIPDEAMDVGSMRLDTENEQNISVSNHIMKNVQENIEKREVQEELLSTEDASYATAPPQDLQEVPSTLPFGPYGMAFPVSMSAFGPAVAILPSGALLYLSGCKLVLIHDDAASQPQFGLQWTSHAISLEEGSTAHILSGHREYIASFCTSEDGEHVTTASFEEGKIQVCIWETLNYTQVHKLYIDDISLLSVVSLNFDPTSALLLLAVSVPLVEPVDPQVYTTEDSIQCKKGATSMQRVAPRKPLDSVVVVIDWRRDVIVARSHVSHRIGHIIWLSRSPTKPARSQLKEDSAVVVCGCTKICVCGGAAVLEDGWHFVTSGSSIDCWAIHARVDNYNTTNVQAQNEQCWLRRASYKKECELTADITAFQIVERAVGSKKLQNATRRVVKDKKITPEDAYEAVVYKDSKKNGVWSHEWYIMSDSSAPPVETLLTVASKIDSQAQKVYLPIAQDQIFRYGVIPDDTGAVIGGESILRGYMLPKHQWPGKIAIAGQAARDQTRDHQNYVRDVLQKRDTSVQPSNGTYILCTGDTRGDIHVYQGRIAGHGMLARWNTGSIADGTDRLVVHISLRADEDEIIVVTRGRKVFTYKRVFSFQYILSEFVQKAHDLDAAVSTRHLVGINRNTTELKHHGIHSTVESFLAKAALRDQAPRSATGLIAEDVRQRVEKHVSEELGVLAKRQLVKALVMEGEGKADLGYGEDAAALAVRLPCEAEEAVSLISQVDVDSKVRAVFFTDTHDQGLIQTPTGDLLCFSSLGAAAQRWAVIAVLPATVNTKELVPVCDSPFLFTRAGSHVYLWTLAGTTSTPGLCVHTKASVLNNPAHVGRSLHCLFQKQVPAATCIAAEQESFRPSGLLLLRLAVGTQTGTVQVYDSTNDLLLDTCSVSLPSDMQHYNTYMNTKYKDIEPADVLVDTQGGVSHILWVGGEYLVIIYQGQVFLHKMHAWTCCLYEPSRKMMGKASASGIYPYSIDYMPNSQKPDILAVSEVILLLHTSTGDKQLWHQNLNLLNDQYTDLHVKSSMYAIRQQKCISFVSQFAPVLLLDSVENIHLVSKQSLMFSFLPDAQVYPCTLPMLSNEGLLTEHDFIPSWSFTNEVVGKVATFTSKLTTKELDMALGTLHAKVRFLTHTRVQPENTNLEELVANPGCIGRRNSAVDITPSQGHQCFYNMKTKKLAFVLSTPYPISTFHLSSEGILFIRCTNNVEIRSQVNIEDIYTLLFTNTRLLTSLCTNAIAKDNNTLKHQYNHLTSPITPQHSEEYDLINMSKHADYIDNCPSKEVTRMQLTSPVLAKDVTRGAPGVQAAAFVGSYNTEIVSTLVLAGTDSMLLNPF